MMLNWVLGVALIALPIMECQKRDDSTLYEDQYLDENTKEFGPAEFAHLASRWTSFIGIGGTSQRTGVEVTSGGRGTGGSQFQDQIGNVNEHAAHHIQGRMTGTNREMRDRLGHTDIITVDLNRRIGTILDEIQAGVLKDKLLNDIHFENGLTDANLEATKIIQQRYVERLKQELKDKDGEVNNANFNAKEYNVLRDLLTIAIDIYNSPNLLKRGLRAGIINRYNALAITNKIETTAAMIPENISLP